MLGLTRLGEFSSG